MDEKTVQSSDIIDAEIVDSTVNTGSSSDQTTLLLSIEELIKKHITKIDRLHEELKKYKETFDDAFNGSEVYRELDAQAKDATKKKAETRMQITKQPSVMTVSDKIKNMRQEMKELRAALSDYLLEYQRLSGLTEIQGEDGEYREIIQSAKAIKRSAKK